MKFFKLIGFATLLATSSLAAIATDSLPEQWYQAGSNTKDYKVGTDTNKGYTGTKSAFIESTIPSPAGFSTLMQYTNVSEYKGKRVKMTAYVCSENVTGWAGAWFRADKNERSVAFDNMSNRAIKGTTAWTQYSIVLDIPEDATNMAFGVLLAGAGKVWFDDFEFQVVDNSVPVTDMKTDGRSEPKNLSFEND